MALVIVAGTENYGLDLITGKSTTPVALTLRLFSSDTTITGATVVGDLTECALTGYSSVALTASNWSASSQASTKGSTSYPAITFNFSNVAAGNVYGLYLTNTSSGALVAAEKFAAVRSVIDGDSLTVTLNLTLASEN